MTSHTPPPIRIERAAQPHGARPIAEEAARFAGLDQVESEAIIDARAAEAVRRWRLDEATYWQRVKFHARLLRTCARRAAGNTVA